VDGLDKVKDSGVVIVGVDQFTIGGFAGDNVVEKEHRLSKFDGKTICVAANWMSTSTLDYLLSCERIKVRVAVSKNVCHGIGTN
jgi:hypothetical protein